MHRRRDRARARDRLLRGHPGGTMRRILMARGGFAALALGVAVSGCGYNRIQQMDETTNQLKANIDAELMRRNDLIPNLVSTVEEAAKFEKQTYTQVAEARSGLSAARDQLASAVKAGA